MLRSVVPVLFLLSCLLVPLRADAATAEYDGFAWETGGFPPSNPGDLFNAVGVVHTTDLPIDLGVNEATIFIGNLISTGQVHLGPDLLAVFYVGGDFELWLDRTMNSDFGVDPPNATVPSTFVDGTLLLNGIFTSFSILWDTSTNTGTFEGNLAWIGGRGIGSVAGSSMTTGGLLGPDNGNAPKGYDLALDEAILTGNLPVPVESSTWGAVKSTFR